MKITVSELSNEHHYKLLHALEHDELISFVQIYIKKWNMVTISYTLFNLCILGFMGNKIYRDITTGNMTWDSILTPFGLGIGLALLVGFYIHEHIHLLAYKVLGAKDTNIVAKWRQFIFLALADKFVLNRKEFYFLAFLPFIIITSVLLLALPFANQYTSYLILGILLFHTAGCSGDFSLVSYFHENRDRNIITYDDVPEKKSYFYEII